MQFWKSSEEKNLTKNSNNVNKQNKVVMEKT